MRRMPSASSFVRNSDWSRVWLMMTSWPVIVAGWQGIGPQNSVWNSCNRSLDPMTTAIRRYSGSCGPPVIEARSGIGTFPPRESYSPSDRPCRAA